MRQGNPLGMGSVARILHVSKPCVLNWINLGALKAFTTYGGHHRVWQADIKELEKSQHSRECRQHQSTPLPARQRPAIGAGGDKTQQADILLLVMPQLPAKEGDQQVGAQGGIEKVECRGAG